MFNYQELNEELQAYLDPSPVATLANASALLFQQVPDLNWVGFYLWDGTELVLGPFQGRPACVRIRSGQGVCGTAFANKQSVLVPDVDQFPGHIVCDSRSKSELVIPLKSKTGNVVGVLDLDSETLNRFTLADQQGLEKFASTLSSIFS